MKVFSVSKQHEGFWTEIYLFICFNYTIYVSLQEDLDEDTAETCFLEFHASHGKNIELSNQNLTACRTDSYNQAIVLSHRPLIRNHVFKVTILAIENMISYWFKKT